ncbi:hypothetical protein EMVG_00253 [Emiliania huxleyi virus PS401]|nr:hypothetical protein EMVG_00253 [Emiliania huxleyi virus PS401]
MTKHRKSRHALARLAQAALVQTVPAVSLMPVAAAPIPPLASPRVAQVEIMVEVEERRGVMEEGMVGGETRLEVGAGVLAALPERLAVAMGQEGEGVGGGRQGEAEDREVRGQGDRGRQVEREGARRTERAASQCIGIRL